MDRFPHSELASATIYQLRRSMDSGELTAVRLTEKYLERIAAIDQGGPGLRAVVEVNPDALDIAAEVDQRWARGEWAGPLDGIPILVKDNIDTRDRMQTTAGSLALVGKPAAADAPVIARLRQAGVIILGKTNLSEWAGFRSTHSASGWSGRGRQTLNPYVLDRSPSGSSSGSAVAVAAGLCAAAVGTETSGSIISPSSMNGVVGYKPAIGRVPQTGIIPIAQSQDTAGTHARSIADAYGVYACMAGELRWPHLTVGSLHGLRIGAVRERFNGYSAHADRIFDDALLALRDCGADIIDPIRIEGDRQLRASEAAMTLLLYEFKAGVSGYLSSRTGVPATSIDEVIRFNEAHSEEELRYFGQELLHRAAHLPGLDAAEYMDAKRSLVKLSRTQGIDAAMTDYGLDAIAAPSDGPAFVLDSVNGDRPSRDSSQLAAVSGYPHVTVPAGFAFGELPVGLSLFAPPDREGRVMQIAAAFEAATRIARPPRYLPTIRVQ